MKKFLSFLCASFVLLVPVTHAQEAPVKAIPVAQVGVTNCGLSPEGRTLHIHCTFSNGQGVQPDVHYAVLLMRDSSAGAVQIDQKVFDDVLVLDSQKPVRKEITYILPPYVSGKVHVLVRAANSDGVIFSNAYVGAATAEALPGSVEILPETCYLQISGEADKYPLDFGVDLTKDEQLIAYCDVKNTTQQQVQAIYTPTTYYRTLFGSVVPTSGAQESVLTFAPGEVKKSVALPIYLPDIPQAYDTALRFYAVGGSLISNTIPAHYVIKGVSATVQNIVLDKSSYSKGETAIVTAGWLGSADISFATRTLGTHVDVEKFVLTITDQAGGLCAEKAEKRIQSGELQQAKPISFQVPITKTCSFAKATIEIIDKNGTTLASKTVDSKDSNAGSKLNLTYVGIGAGAALVLLGVGFYLYRRHRNISNANITPIS